MVLCTMLHLVLLQASCSTRAVASQRHRRTAGQRFCNCRHAATPASACAGAQPAVQEASGQAKSSRRRCKCSVPCQSHLQSGGKGRAAAVQQSSMISIGLPGSFGSLQQMHLGTCRATAARSTATRRLTAAQLPVAAIGALHYLNLCSRCSRRSRHSRRSRRS